MARKICEMAALERVFVVGQAYERAEKMVAEASVFSVDQVIDGVEDFFREQGVETGNFIHRLRAMATEKHAANRRAMDRIQRFIDEAKVS